MKLLSLSSTKPSPAVRAAWDRLTRLTQESPDLCEAADFLRATIPLLHQASLLVEPLRIDAHRIQAKLAAGIFALFDEELPIDSSTSKSLFLKLCKAVELQHAPVERQPAAILNLFLRKNTFSERHEERAKNADMAAQRSLAARHIRRAVEAQELQLSDVFSQQSSGTHASPVLSNTKAQLDVELLQVLAQNTLKPFLRKWAGSIHADTSAWNRGQCPMCGATPTLSEIVGKTAARRLRCGMCGCGWDYPRLCCAFCGNQEHKLLTKISVEGDDDHYFVQACNVCRGFLKMLVHFEPLAVEQLAVEDLATMHLDFAASRLNYARIKVR